MSDITSKPSTTFYSVLNGASENRVGHLGVRIIRLSDGSVIDPRTTEHIIELSPKVYRFTGEAPAETGKYAVIWDDSGVSTSDELNVTNSSQGEANVDFTQPVGQVRLLIADTGGEDEETFLFQDIAIEAFLMLEDDSVFGAAAIALRSIAGNEAQVQKVTTALEVETDGAKLATALIKLAESYEAKAEEDYELDIAEMGVDLFSRRQLRYKVAEGLEQGVEGIDE